MAPASLVPASARRAGAGWPADPGLMVARTGSAPRTVATMAIALMAYAFASRAGRDRIAGTHSALQAAAATVSVPCHPHTVQGSACATLAGQVRPASASRSTRSCGLAPGIAPGMGCAWTGPARATWASRGQRAMKRSATRPWPAPPATCRGAPATAAARASACVASARAGRPSPGATVPSPGAATSPAGKRATLTGSLRRGASSAWASASPSKAKPASASTTPSRT
mmetsp:Transcript_68249/g.220558  ORF Transcript_68249/g.220558 Transcript_68249/m.220558 type:complete len:227 (+) Transcript_68249:126-806(+)